MSNFFFYILFSLNRLDTSNLALFNNSSKGFYLLTPKDKRIFITKELPSINTTYFKFDYFKYSHIQRKETFITTDIVEFDTVFIEPNGFQYIDFKAVKNDMSDSIPIQNLFRLKLVSKDIGVIKKNNRRYHPLKTKSTLFFDYRNFSSLRKGKF